MKKLVFVAFVLLGLEAFSSNILTQTVRGVVIDKNTKMTLPGANVILLDSNPLRGTMTDEQGRFKFESVEIGRVSLKVSFLGYNDIVLSNLNLQVGKELVLNIEMEELAVNVEAVVVTANADKSTPMNKLATVSARSFTVEETERYAGSRNDVARMASNFAGVMGVDDARNDIIIRGNSPMGLLWRLEGVDIPNPNHWGATGTTGGPVNMLNNNLLENSDFMTSAFAPEYGNAISGVFDLKMRSGNNEKYEFLGQVGFNGFEFGAEGPISKENGSSFLINYRYSTLGVFEKMGMDLGTTGIPYYQDLSFKFNFPKTPIGSISVFGLGGISDIKLWDSKRDTLKDKIDLYGGEGFDVTNGSDMGVVGINNSYIIDENTYVKSSVAFMAHQFQTVVDSLSKDLSTKYPHYRNDFVDNTVSFSSFINKRLNSKNTVKAGFYLKQLGFNYIDSMYVDSLSQFVDIRNDDGSTWLLQPYIQWQYKPTNQITVNTGVHYMYLFLNNSWSVEPRIGIRWQFAPSHSISVGYGLHSQAVPVATALSRVRLSDGSYVQPNKDLDLIKSHHFVLGYDWRINQSARVKIETYYQRILNAAIDAEESSAYSILNEGANFGVFTPEYLKSTGTGYNYGVELTLERFLNKGYYFLITASLFDSKYKGSDGLTHNTAFSSNYVMNGLVGKEFVFGNAKSLKSLGFDIKTVYSGGKRATPWHAVYNTNTQQYEKEYYEDQAFDLRLRDYFKTDFTIRFKLNKFGFTQEWAIEVTNLFDNKNIYGEKFNTRTGEGSFTNQLGRMIIPQYRITF